jgi:hypothetical protein
MSYVSNMNAHMTRKLSRFKRLNRKGGIEGLPMELMIIVVIAALGTAVLVGWMGNIETPETIGHVDSSVDQIVMTSDKSTNVNFTITVTDTSGDAISGATVVLTGCNVSKGTSGTTVYGVTNSAGQVAFSGLSLQKTTSGVGYINVSVSAGDYGEDSSLRIPVVR